MSITSNNPSEPVDPWRKNPYAVGTEDYQKWEHVRALCSDSLLWTKEHLALFTSDTLGSMPAEEASLQEFSDHLLNALAGIFDINARGLSRLGALTDDAAQGFEHLLGELVKAMLAKAETFPVSFIPKQLFSSELRTRLNQRKLYWTGQMLRMVREHKENNSASSEPKTTSDLTPTANRVTVPQPAAPANAKADGQSDGHEANPEPWHTRLRAARNKAQLSRPGAAMRLRTRGVQITSEAIKKHEEGAAMPRPDVRRAYESIYGVGDGEIFPPEN
jgi:ribosome-binding protein aMBF1 (putative translation factor)